MKPTRTKILTRLDELDSEIARLEGTIDEGSVEETAERVAAIGEEIARLDVELDMLPPEPGEKIYA
jgi:uncharacterized small protein (DUF1192 family)